MRQISKSSWMYQWFDNTLTARVVGFAGPPKTDCSFFWGLLWNGLLYVIIFGNVLMAPLTFLSAFTSLFVEFTGFDFIVTGRYFLDGLLMLVDILPEHYRFPFLFIFCLFAAVAGYAMVISLLIGCPIAAAICLIGFTAAYFEDRRTGGEPIMFVDIVVDRARGMKDNFCTPIKFVEDES